MITSADATKAWLAAFKSACKGHKLQFVSDAGFLVDELYISSLDVTVFPRGNGELQVSWTIAIKPIAVDDILWESFLPEVQMGARMRINRRINGTVRVWSLPLAGGRRIVPLDSPPDWRAELDEFLRTRDEFIAQHPSAASFVAALRAHSDAEQRPSVNIVREITALLAAGSNAEAADVADAAIARGEQGNMSSDTYVTKYLAAYARVRKPMPRLLPALHRHTRSRASRSTNRGSPRP